MFDILDGRPYFWQWDSNQKLLMTGFNEGYQVHFKNNAVEEMLTTLIYRNDDGVLVCDVPNILLTTDDDINVYVFVEDSLGNRTVRQRVLRVKGREKPTDYIYTETEVYNFTTVVEKALEDAKASGEFNGEDGQSAYEIAVKYGFQGTEQEWLESLESEDGYTPQKGVDYWTNEDVAEIHEYVDEQTKIIKSDLKCIQEDIHNEAHFRGYVSTNVKIKAMEATPNDFAYSAESGTVWIYDAEEGWKETNTPVPDKGTPLSNATPLINGEASPGISEEGARSDHRHPTDTTRASVTQLNEAVEGVKTELKAYVDKTILGGEW